MAPPEGKLTCVCAPSWAITVAVASCCSIFLVPGARVPRLRRRVARERGQEQLVRLACVSRGSHGTHMGAIFGVSPRSSSSSGPTAPGRQSTSRKPPLSPFPLTSPAQPPLSPPGQPLLSMGAMAALPPAVQVSNPVALGNRRPRGPSRTGVRCARPDRTGFFAFPSGAAPED